MCKDAAMRITLAHVSPRGGNRTKMQPIQALVDEYATRCRGWDEVEDKGFASEERLVDAASAAGRTRAVVCLLDGRGKRMSSEEFAGQFRRWREAGRQQVFCCVGPADGWSDAARQRADLVLSLGPMTLAHGIARVVLAEQVYRALSILAGHPYHGGH